MVSILGITRGIEAKSEKIKATLDDLRAKETEIEYQIELSGDALKVEKFRGLQTNLFKHSMDAAKTKPSEWGVLVSLKGKHPFYPYTTSSSGMRSSMIRWQERNGSGIVWDMKE